jgi:SAM-dependent methyltransferase
LLDDAYAKLRDEQLDDAAYRRVLDELFLSLGERRQNSTEDEWNAFVAACRRHPVLALLHEDPFTYRAFSKPRGYAGDAVMIDYIYGREEQWTLPEMTTLGRRIFDYTTLAPASEGVRARRGFIADLLDRLAFDRRLPHVLSVASGHLREASLSSAVRRRKLGRLVALDGDAASLREVERCYRFYGVETVPAKVIKLISPKFEIGQFDLVYSTGLFDYLDAEFGRRLVSAMFRRVRPGGQLVVANFLTGVRDVGYMEAFMDWRLIYRSRLDMVDLTMEIPQAEIRDLEISAEECQNIIFLKVTKA